MGVYLDLFYCDFKVFAGPDCEEDCAECAPCFYLF